MILLGVASLIASGVLFRHRTVLTYLATAGILWEAHWLFLTLLDRGVLHIFYDIPRTLFRQAVTDIVFLIGTICILLGWTIVGWARRKGTPRMSWDWRNEVIIAIVLLVVLGAGRVIFSFNSFYETSSFVTHGFFNGDTATLVALTQRAFSTGGLITENPFAGNGSLEYPSLLHSGLASLWATLDGMDWLEWLPLMTYLQILLTVPMFFLMWDAVLPDKRGKWLSVLVGIISLYVMMLSWESYVYPQGHFFLVGMFLLMAALLAKSWGKTIAQSYPELGVAVLLGIVLLFSNAVTGTAAIVLKIVFDGLHVIKRGVSLGERFGWTIGVLFWVILFFLFTPGNGSLTLLPHFAYTAAAELGRLSPILILVAVGIFLQYERKLFLSLAALGLLGLALVTFIFSSRGIVVENASRFIYHAILIAFPFAFMPLTRVYYWFRREFWLSSRLFWEKVLGWGLAVTLLGMFLLPAGASVASTHDNLMFKDEHRISEKMRDAAGWISTNTSPESAFLISPETPFWVPMFTGRAMLRSDFWLSPDDVVLADVKAAFTGSVAAQEKVITQADYLAVTRSEKSVWKLSQKPIFENPDVAIYQLR